MAAFSRSRGYRGEPRLRSEEAEGHAEANRLVFKYVAHEGPQATLARATTCRRLAALRSMVCPGGMIGRVWDGSKLEPIPHS